MLSILLSRAIVTAKSILQFASPRSPKRNSLKIEDSSPGGSGSGCSSSGGTGSGGTGSGRSESGGSRASDESKEVNEKTKIKINVGGELFVTYLSTLERFPDTLLGNKEVGKVRDVSLPLHLHVNCVSYL